MNRLEMDVNDLISHNHIDLYVFISNSFIFPVQSYALKELGELFNYPSKHSYLNGFKVAKAYFKHIENKIPLEQTYFEYGEDDVKLMKFLINSLIEGNGIIKKEIDL